jgi:FixJ family two-component response regulator
MDLHDVMVAGRPRSTIAVVDDDPSVLHALDLLLSSADHGVQTFSSAAAMLASGCLEEVDCLISDIGMPGMDGVALISRVRATRPALPVILISGRADALDRLAGLTSREYHLFSKPLDGQALLDAIRDALGGSVHDRGV